MKPKEPQETASQRQVRLRSEADNVRAIQETAQQRTSIFQRLRNPRVSIATGASSAGVSLLR